MKKAFLILFFSLIGLFLLSGCIKRTEVFGCTEKWECTPWSECRQGTQTRACNDLSNCGTDANRPEETQSCLMDPCIGVSCPDKCDGSTLMSAGRCVNGKCAYTATENSANCGYILSQLKFETILRFCEYSKFVRKYDFFFTVKTVGEKNPDPKASIWLIPSESSYNKPYFTVQKIYNYGETLWQNIMWSGIPYKGRMWTINDAPSFENFNYKLLYCELTGYATEPCSEREGIVLYSGNSVTDCNVVA